MTGRSRSRNIPTTGIFDLHFFGGPSVAKYYTDWYISKSLCNDVADQPNMDHNFDVSHYDASRWKPMSGEAKSGTYQGSTYTNVGASYDGFLGTHLSVDLPDIAGEITRLTALTNPSRPGVTPLSLLQDVVELPKMLKDVGRLIRNPTRSFGGRDLANHYLAVKFGWLPFVQDIKAVLTLQSQIHNRTKEIERLYSASGLRRRISLGSTRATDKMVNFNISSTPGLEGWVDIDRLTQATRWGTIRWKPTSLPPLDSSTPSYNALARKVVSGFTIEGLNKGAWDLIPWSFIVNWFSNIGGFMQSNSNTIPALPESACVMTHTTTSNSFTRKDTNGDLKGGDGDITYETKARQIGGATLNASLPFMGAEKLSILGALAVQRFLR